jgi:Superfamily II DNA/RNA helicases, SNF2 family
MVRHDLNKVLDLPPLREDIFLLPPVKIVLDEETEFVHSNIDALLNLSIAMGQPLSQGDSPDKFLRLIGAAILENVSLIGHPDFQPLFSKFAEIRKKTGLAKLPYVIDLIREKTDDCIIPVVAFGYHREFMQGLKTAFPDFSYVVGGMSSKKRKDEVTRFQNGETPGFLGNIDAAGEAITLTRASLAIFGEMDWRGTQMVQARKRIHRISQTQSCQILFACAARSFDAYVAEQAFEKMRNMKETLDLGYN